MNLAIHSKYTMMISILSNKTEIKWDNKNPREIFKELETLCLLEGEWPAQALMFEYLVPQLVELFEKD